MVNQYNYYGVRGDFVWHYVFSVQFSDRGYRPALFRLSNEVWQQGPRGGIKLVYSDLGLSGQYVTNNEEAMKRFTWLKLKATSLHNEGELEKRG